MSIPNLGLSEKQLSFLTYFKKQKTDVFSPRPDVFRSQKQRLTESVKLIGQLDAAWNSLSQETDKFNTQFPSFSEEALSKIALHIQNWSQTKRSLDQMAAEASKVYLPERIKNDIGHCSNRMKQADKYLGSVKEYLELCNIEREIEGQYHAAKRNYQTIENINNRYQKLSLEIKNFFNDGPRRMLQELMGKVELLHRFNKAMASLAEGYSRLAQPVRSGTLVFAYHSLASIKKDLAPVSGWLAEFKKLDDWVNNQSEENRGLLVGANCVAQSNMRGEYQTYVTAAAKMKALAEESSYFYRAAEICADIEALGQNKYRKKQDVDKLWRSYNALEARTSKHIDAAMVAKLNSMLDSQDKMAQLDDMIATLDRERIKCNISLSGNKLNYSFDKYPSLHAEAEKAAEWLANYESLRQVLKMLQGKLEIQPAKEQKITSFKTHATKLEAVLAEMNKVTRAYEFEAPLVNQNITLSSEESLLNEYRKTFEKLPADVKDYVSPKWSSLLSQFATFHRERQKLVKQVEELEKEYETLDKQWREPSYVNHNSLAYIPGQEERLSELLSTLRSDFSKFKKEYNDTGNISLTALDRHAEKLKDRRKTVEELRRCKNLYDWAKSFEKLPMRYSTEDLSKQHTTFHSDQTRYLKFDSNQELVAIFNQVSAELQARAKVQQKKESKARAKKSVITVITLLLAAVAVGAIVLMVMKNQEYVEQGRYWNWFGLTAAVSVFSAVVLGFTARSKKVGLIFGTLCALYLVGYSVPFYLKSLETIFWFLPWIILGVLICMVISAMYDSEVGYVFGSIFGIAAALFLIGIVIWMICVAWGNADFLDKTFFGQIGNFFIGAWALLVGLVSGLFKAIMFIIGGGFWVGSAELIDALLNAIFFCLLGGALGGWIIGFAKE